MKRPARHQGRGNELWSREPLHPINDPGLGYGYGTYVGRSDFAVACVMLWFSLLLVNSLAVTGLIKVAVRRPMEQGMGDLVARVAACVVTSVSLV